MAFRATTVIPATAYDDIRRAAASLKSDAQAAIAQMEAGTVPFSFVVTVVLALKAADARLVELAGVPGIAEYAQAQEAGTDYDVAAEFISLRERINEALTWVDLNLPRSVVVSDPLDWTGPDVINTGFAPQVTETFRNVLSGVVNTIA